MERRAEWESWCSSEARPIQRRNPPSSQINIAGSLLRLLPSPSLFPLLLLLSGFFHYSSVRSESAHSSSPPAAPALSTEPLPPLVGPPHFGLIPGSKNPHCNGASEVSLIFQHQEAAVTELLNLLLRRDASGERRGFFFRPFKESCPSASVFLSLGLQFWLCVGRRKRDPKCLKQITCCRCLGVTSRCVALSYLRRFSGYRTHPIVSHCLAFLCFN